MMKRNTDGLPRPRATRRLRPLATLLAACAVLTLPPAIARSQYRTNVEYPYAAEPAPAADSRWSTDSNAPNSPVPQSGRPIGGEQVSPPATAPMPPSGSLYAAPSPAEARGNSRVLPVSYTESPAEVPALAPVGAGALRQPAHSDAPMPLAPPHRTEGGLLPTNLSPSASPMSAAVTVGGSLVIVLTLFFVVAWIMRRGAPAGQGVLPGEVFELLGRAPLSGRQQAYLLRLGRKLVLVSLTPAGAETLAEVTDPAEVDRLAGLCQQNRSGSVTTSFRKVLEGLGARDAAAADAPAAAHGWLRDERRGRGGYDV